VNIVGIFILLYYLHEHNVSMKGSNTLREWKLYRVIHEL